MRTLIQIVALYARQQVRTPHRLTLVCRTRTPRRPGPQRNLDLSFAAHWRLSECGDGRQNQGWGRGSL